MDAHFFEKLTAPMMREKYKCRFSHEMPKGGIIITSIVQCTYWTWKGGDPVCMEGIEAKNNPKCNGKVIEVIDALGNHLCLSCLLDDGTSLLNADKETE